MKKTTLVTTKTKESYIVAIDDILIGSESIINAPSFSVNIKYNDIPDIVDNFGGHRILSAIEYEDVDFELVQDEETFELLMAMFHNKKSVRLTILKKNIEVVSIGVITSVNSTETTMGFCFKPHMVTNN